MSQPQQTITRTPCPEELRMEFLPNAVGNKFLQYEALTFTFMDKACHEYNGGHWHFYHLSNGGFYMAPNRSDKLEMTWADNFFEGEMSADAAGIAISLMAQNAFAWEVDAGRFTEKYHALLDYASEHEEGALIYRFID
ncbi:MAG: antirestriction protein [Opitutales bacterium]